MDRGAALVSDAWQRLEDELARWRAAGRRVEFWWRDDDAAQWTPALAQLVGLAQRFAVPLALAVVPSSAEAALFAQLPDAVSVLQHGVDHRNRGAAGAKRTEFAAEARPEEAVARIAAGAARLAALAGPLWSAVFAPPWNRLPEALAERLPQAGLRGLSRFGPRACARPAPGLVQVNTHVDLVAWRGERGFVGTQAALEQAVGHLAARRLGRADPEEPTGWLTHHLQHDAATWRFLEQLFERSCAASAVHWSSARTLFAQAAPA
jgi:hypothetical protein